MTYQIRPLFHQILLALGKPLSHYDPHFPIQIKTVTAVNRLQVHTSPFIGIAILPGRLNVLLRPKVFMVETTAAAEDSPITTYSIVIMDAAGDLRLVEDLTVDHTDPDGLSHFIKDVANLVEEQARHNHHDRTPNPETIGTLHHAALQIAKESIRTWPGWIIYILEELQGHTNPTAYGEMLAELSLAVEAWELEGAW